MKSALGEVPISFWGGTAAPTPRAGGQYLPLAATRVTRHQPRILAEVQRGPPPQAGSPTPPARAYPQAGNGGRNAT